MAKKKQKKKKKMPEQVQRPKDFLDMIAPAAVKFNTDHFILGSRYHTAMTLKSYPPMTDELALLRGLGDMGGVNLRLTARQVTPAEEDAILHAATNKSRMERSNTNDYKQSVTAEANLRDMAELLAKQRQEKEPLIHCGVYLDIAAADTEKLRTARDTVSAQLVRSRMGADPLLLRQREGFLSANQPACQFCRAGITRTQCCQSVPHELFRQNRSQGLLHWAGPLRFQYHRGLRPPCF